MRAKLLLLILISIPMSSCRSPEERLKTLVHEQLQLYLQNQSDEDWERLFETWQTRKQRQGIYYHMLLEERQELSYDHLPVWGSPEARIRILAFIDVDDVYSRMMFENLEILKRRYGKELVIFYGYNPQNNLLNSESAARAIWALDQQGRAWDYVRWALGSGLKARSEDIRAWVAEQSGIDKKKFEEDWASGGGDEIISSSQRQAHELGTPNTPVLYVEGVALRGVQSLNHYIPMVEAAREFLDLQAEDP